MRWLDAIVLRLRTALRRDHANRDLDAEVAFYLEREVEKNLARGLSREEARRQARLAFGSLDAAKDDCRAAWGLQAVENLARDVRHGLRGLGRAPGFTTMVLATLGVGIASLAVLRILHGDVAHLRERMATLEGTVDPPTGFPIDREAGRAAGGTDGA